MFSGRKFLMGLLAVFTIESVGYCDGVAMSSVELGKPATLKFAIEPEARCSFGDLDVMALDLADENTSLQLSVEEFGATG